MQGVKTLKAGSTSSAAEQSETAVLNRHRFINSVLALMLTVFRSLTCFGLHREVGLPLQDGVDELGVVSKHGVVGIRGRHLGNRGPCGGGVRISSCDSSIWQGDYSKVISQQGEGRFTASFLISRHAGLPSAR